MNGLLFRFFSWVGRKLSPYGCAALLVMGGCLFPVGCKTANVRMSLIDIDTRSPEQLAAAQYEAGVPYETAKAACQGQALGADKTAKALSPDIYAELINVLPKLKWHIKLFSFEGAPVCRATAGTEPVQGVRK